MIGLIMARGFSSPARSEATSYENPVHAGDFPDPTVIRHEGTCDAFATTGSRRLADGRIFTVVRTEDMVTWGKVG